MEELALLDLPTRLGRLLARMARDSGRPVPPRGRRIELALSQRELATLVGASREQVNKLLRAWEEDGTIGKDGSHLVVLRADRLAPDM